MEHYFCSHIKEVLPDVRMVKYFSDGAASQYKNFKNLENVMHHQKDFGLMAEWHFFATSHGKSPCDGIGGTVKRLAARASLQATTTDHILNPLQLFQWAERHIQGIKFFFVSKDQVEAKAGGQEARFSSAKKVPGIRSHHCFIPTSNGQLRMFRVSADTTGTLVQEPQDLPNMQYVPGQYIAAVYDQKWYVGSIVECDEEKQDVLVSFMAQVGTSRSFKWPRRADNCWVLLGHILCNLPVPCTTTGRQYQYEEKDINSIKDTFLSFANLHF